MGREFQCQQKAALVPDCTDGPHAVNEPGGDTLAAGKFSLPVIKGFILKCACLRLDEIECCSFSAIFQL